MQLRNSIGQRRQAAGQRLRTALQRSCTVDQRRGVGIQCAQTACQVCHTAGICRNTGFQCTAAVSQLDDACRQALRARKQLSVHCLLYRLQSAGEGLYCLPSCRKQLVCAGLHGANAGLQGVHCSSTAAQIQAGQAAGKRGHLCADVADVCCQRAHGAGETAKQFCLCSRIQRLECIGLCHCGQRRLHCCELCAGILCAGADRCQALGQHLGQCGSIRHGGVLQRLVQRLNAGLQLCQTVCHLLQLCRLFRRQAAVQGVRQSL
ncbi:unknown [Ruminococcus sp. CAG:330]|nr:unknown [Ruminococcus sp. CAG:330]